MFSSQSIFSIYKPTIFFLFSTFLLVNFSVDACAPTGTGAETRRKRSIEDDVHVVVLSTKEFILSENEDNMKTVENKLKEFADKEGISFKQLQKLPRTSENVGGRFGVHFTVEGAFDKCSRILQFIQSATNEIEEMVSGTVKCGEFDAVHVTKEIKGEEKSLSIHDEKIQEESL